MTKVNERNNFSREKQIYLWVIDRGRHWDPNPMGSQSQSQIFGIGIDFSEFWDWDWHRFFKILGLGFGLQIQDKIPRNPEGRYRNFK